MANVTDTQKQRAICQSLVAFPRQSGETKTAYCRRIGGKVGAHPQYVYYLLRAEEFRKIGEEMNRRRGETTEVAPAMKANRKEAYPAAFMESVRDIAERASKRATI